MAEHVQRRVLFDVAFSALVFMAVVSGACYVVMRIRLMRMDTARSRIEWLSLRSGDEVLDTYEGLFPGSFLPRFCRGAFWTFIVVVLVVFACSVLKYH
jgi:hypothetical protein